MATEEKTPKTTLKDRLGMMPMTRSDFGKAYKNLVRILRLGQGALIAKVDAKLATVKDGYTPIKGKDYFDGKDAYVPVKGKDYFDGEPGYTPIKGKDYFDGLPGDPGDSADEAAIEARVLSEAVPRVLDMVEKQLPVLGDPIRDSLELLQGDNRLNYTAIKGLETYLTEVAARQAGGGNFQGIAAISVMVAGVMKVQMANTFNFTGAGAPTVTTQANGVTQLNFPSATPAFYTDTISGTIDGSNKAFSVAHTIVSSMILCLAGIPYQPGIDFTTSGTTINFVLAPDASLSGQPFWLLHT